MEPQTCGFFTVSQKLGPGLQARAGPRLVPLQQVVYSKFELGLTQNDRLLVSLCHFVQRCFRCTTFEKLLLYNSCKHLYANISTLKNGYLINEKLVACVLTVGQFIERRRTHFFFSNYIHTCMRKFHFHSSYGFIRDVIF